MPTWQLGAGIVLSFLAFSLAGLIALRGWIYNTFRISDSTNEPISAVFAGVGMLYGLLLGLVAVAAWQNFDSVGSLASKEAASIAALYRDISALQEPAKHSLQNYLADYLAYVIDVEWPLHRHGESPNDGAVILTGFYGVLSGYQPDSISQQILLSESVTAFNHLIELRRARMDSVDVGIPAVFWVVMLAGAFLIIPLIYFFHLPSMKTHLALTAVFSIFLGFMIFLMAAVDNPLRGEVSISPDSYQAIQDSLKNFDPVRSSQ
ncbi:DUF4239 domain-containing protein [Candidatus Methylospira mobilis]|uniref:bestrophin-like domain n=1 Tax=Candidatus Methylospira mobilis TaxID=1808979 RepID=UPI0028EBE06E|nr:DUF4239 domain-containing protein [Candidatus Methylospira mobilis]WNV03919.1 DUF4239 domain-containing protein [Candidatus Methylospira mobilis]